MAQLYLIASCSQGSISEAFESVLHVYVAEEEREMMAYLEVRGAMLCVRMIEVGMLAFFYFPKFGPRKCKCSHTQNPQSFSSLVMLAQRGTAPMEAQQERDGQEGKI